VDLAKGPTYGTFPEPLSRHPKFPKLTVPRLTLQFHFHFRDPNWDHQKYRH
jgi:hypothetical protein